MEVAFSSITAILRIAVTPMLALAAFVPRPTGRVRPGVFLMFSKVESGLLVSELTSNPDSTFESIKKKHLAELLLMSGRRPPLWEGQAHGLAPTALRYMCTDTKEHAYKCVHMYFYIYSYNCIENNKCITT